MLLYLILLLFGSSSAVVVETRSGKVKGYSFISRSGREVLSFSGIPYAAPPVGPLRFMEPQPVKPYDGIIDVQSTEPCLSVSGKDIIGTEDCLKLSIQTPSVNSEVLYPVLVYIHGGSWVQGAGQSKYGAQFFMDYDIVVVQLEYRVGILGLLSLESNALPGNMELKDQVMALKWIQENIAYFRGNPNKVTLMGHSTGSASVHYHMISPLSQGFFHAAICESGLATASWAIAVPGAARKFALEFAWKLGCNRFKDDDIVECLQKKDAKDLLKIIQFNNYDHEEVFLQFNYYFGYSVFPVMDNYSTNSFIPVNPHKVECSPIPLITGINNLDGYVSEYRTKEMLQIYSPYLYYDFLFKLFAPKFQLYYHSLSMIEILLRIQKFYFGGLLFGSSSQTAANLTNLYTDFHFGWPLLEALKLHNGPTYVYNLAYDNSVSYQFQDGGKKLLTGSVHSDTTLLLWQQEGFTLDEKAVALSKRLVKMFVDFAYYGNPTLPDHTDFTWPQWDNEAQPFCTIDTYGDFKQDKGFYKERMQFWVDVHKYAPYLDQY